MGEGDTDDEAQGTQGTGERAARLHERGDRSVVCWCAQVQAAKLAGVGADTRTGESAGETDSVPGGAG